MVEDHRHDKERSQGPEQNALDNLSQRIHDAKIASGLEEPEREEGVFSSGHKWSRIGSDFVATVLTTIGLGWLADTQLDTSPWGLIIMLFLGFAVGVTNIWRVLKGHKPTVEWRRANKQRRK